MEYQVMILSFLESTFDEGGKVGYEVREGARLHFITFETRQVEKVYTNLKLHIFYIRGTILRSI